MKRDLPRYVVRLKGVLYFKRRNWQTRRFVCQSVGPEFYAEYATILNGTAPKPNAATIKGLIFAYYRSQKFESLAPRTKDDYRKFLDRFERNAGALAVKSIQRKHVIAWRDQLAASDSPHYANYFVRVLRLLFKYAGDIDELPYNVNPAQGVEAVKYKKQKPKPWPADMIQAARDARPHSDRTRLLFELLYCTGQRVGDVLKMKWADIRGDAIHVSQGKTGADLVIPMTDHLQECLRRAERAGETILTAHRKSTPWAYRGAADAMMGLRKEIGAEDYTIHAIRHTVASEFDDSELGRSITGHKTAKMFEHYAGPERQKRMARKAQKERK